MSGMNIPEELNADEMAEELGYIVVGGNSMFGFQNEDGVVLGVRDMGDLTRNLKCYIQAQAADSLNIITPGANTDVTTRDLNAEEKLEIHTLVGKYNQTLKTVLPNLVMEEGFQ